MNYTDDTRPVANLKISDAHFALSVLNNVLGRVSDRGALATHIEWAKEAVWAAAFPGSPDDSLLNGLEWAADQVG